MVPGSISSGIAPASEIPYGRVARRLVGTTANSDTASGAAPMRIIFLSHGNNLNGAERCLAEAVRGLTHEGHDVGVVVPSDGDLAPVLRDFGATVVIVPHRWWVHHSHTQLTWRQKAKNTAHYFVDANRIRRVIRGMNPQILITNTIAIPTGSLAAKFCRIPHIWYLHEFGEKDHNFVFDLESRFVFGLLTIHQQKSSSIQNRFLVIFRDTFHQPNYRSCHIP